MAYELARNIQDAAVNPAAFALPSSASSSTTSAAIDLGSDSFKAGNFELELSVPALSTTIVPNASTVTYVIESSASSGFGTIAQTLMSEVQTGAGGTGVGAFLKRVRVPSDCARYVRFKVTFGAATTTGAAVNATGTVRF